MTREEAIKKVRWGLLGLVIDKDVRDALETLIPELAESEDERIRAVILKLVLGMRGEIFTTADKLVTKPKVLAWLEKQKEQNPNVEICPHSIKSKSYKENGYPIEDCVQKPAEWSEEDERTIDTIVSVLGQYIDYKAVSGTGSGYATPRYSKEMDWLKSLRPVSKESLQSHWKPSEEQMEALKDAVRLFKETHFEKYHYKIESLYEQLKKL